MSSHGQFFNHHQVSRDVCRCTGSWHHHAGVAAVAVVLAMGQAQRADIQQLSGKIDQVNGRIDQVNLRIDRVNDRIDETNDRMDQLFQLYGELRP